MHRRKGIRFVAFATIATVVSVLALTAASAAPPQGVSMAGTGPQPAGLGMFSKDALAQEHCNAQTGQMWSTWEGGGPWCVNPWPAGKNNGGATAPGVTATTVKVVFYVPNEQMLTGVSTRPKNRVTGANATPADSFKDYQAAYAYALEHNTAYQTWGRTPSIELYTATGADEAAQRADAVAVIAMKPFMVIDATSNGIGAPVFSSMVAAKKIIVGSPSTDTKLGDAQAPYRWNTTADVSAVAYDAAAFLGTTLTGKKAQWAGDSDLKSKTRTFGAIWPTTGFDFETFERLLGQDGGKLTTKGEYDPATVQPGSPELATFVSQLKASGVTSVALFATGPVTQSVMNLATQQDYHPEWLFTGFSFQEYVGFARGYDPDQMAHAYGLAQIGPLLVNDPSQTIFDWYWGSTQGNFWNGLLGAYDFMYRAMHYSGPDLTAQNVQKGLFAAPGQTFLRVSIGKLGYGKTVGMPYEVRAGNGTDRALIWWDPNTVAAAYGAAPPAVQPAKGTWHFLNNGENYAYSDFTKQLPKFFDASASIIQRNALDYYPGGVAPTPAPCTQCPSASATPTGAA